MKRKKVNPREFTKASQVRRVAQSEVQVVGQREPTKHGYRIPGTSCKEYETFFEYLAEGQATDTFMHPKKTRTFRVLDGRGYATLAKDEETKSTVLLPGVELTVEPGVSCVIATTSTDFVSFFVTQSAKYEARMEILKESTTSTEIDSELLQSHSVEDLASQEARKLRRRTGKSKIVEQQIQLAKERGRPVAEEVAQQASAEASQPVSSDTAFTPNLRPSHGSDLRGEPG